jgi:hypothetical protein
MIVNRSTTNTLAVAIRTHVLQQTKHSPKLTGKLQVQPEVQSTSVMQPVETQDCREDSSNGLEATTVVKVKNKATVKKRIGKEFEMGDQE